jgi:hypothetical protein
MLPARELEELRSRREGGMRGAVIAVAVLVGLVSGCPNQSGPQRAASARFATVQPKGLIFLFDDPDDAILPYLVRDDRVRWIAAVGSQGAPCEVTERLTLAGTRVFKVRTLGRKVLDRDLTGNERMEAAELSQALRYGDTKAKAWDRFQSATPTPVEGWTCYVTEER